MNSRYSAGGAGHFAAPFVAWMVVVAHRPLSRIIDVLDAFVTALRALASPVDAWRGRRRRSARDYCELANMSDRELHDIGVSRASVRAIADEDWARDWR
ncbi:MAG: DUF1127 domain-containing protein [Betaproteobacteria bacterium]